MDTSSRNEAPNPANLLPLQISRAAEVSRQSRANAKPLKPPPSMGNFSLKRCQQGANGVIELESESEVLLRHAVWNHDSG